MNALSRLWQKLSGSKEYRDAFVEAQAKRVIPMQIRVLLRQRGWSQAKLGQEAKLSQGVISRAQDPDYGNLTINTLVKIAAGFDVAFVGRFVSFRELGRLYDDLSEESLEVPSFTEEREKAVFVERIGPVSATSSIPTSWRATGTEATTFPSAGNQAVAFMPPRANVQHQLVSNSENTVRTRSI